MTYLEQAAALCGYILAIVGVAALFLKPLRDKLFGLSAVSDGVKCLLRADMLRMYYKHQDTETIRQHERENFEAEYKAYKALGGNSFIDDICHDVREWKALS